MMQTKSYLLLCAAVAACWSLALLYIPAFADTIEQLMLLFLSTNAG